VPPGRGLPHVWRPEPAPLRGAAHRSGLHRVGVSGGRVNSTCSSTPIA
jgi:hypothetical protein